MPLLAHNHLPAFARLAAEGLPVVAPAAWDGPVLRVGLVNTMDDGAIAATERQFLRLLAAAAPDRGIELLPCGLPEVPRGPAARRHCDEHYLDLAALRAARPRALIVTGANVGEPDLDRLHCGASLREVIAWADAEVPRTLYSCLATHAVLHFRHGRRRRALPAKRWGVYPHRLAQPAHPLVAGLADGLVVPHSRWNEVPSDDFAAAGLEVLIVDAHDGGVHLAAGHDGREVFLQGHPEYDPVSLPKEHKREVARFWAGQRDDYPAPPEHICDADGDAMLARHRERVLAARRRGEPELPPYPEPELGPRLRDAWRRDTARFLASWLAGA
jgi:homoserine O-succinyltransferase/O-acetyltransferase